MGKFVKYMNTLLQPFKLVIVHAKNLDLLYQHDYGTDGYKKYKKLQIFHNKRKIDKIWADKDTLAVISRYLKSHVESTSGGICHGTRRGYEQEEFSRQLGCKVIGTEISDTATDFPNTVQWDFHEPRKDWIGKFSFVYSNSLDQAFNPEKAINTWVDQLNADGMLFIEHTMAHSPTGAGEMDPFGAHPMVMPYLLFEWGKDKYSLIDIIHPPHKKNGKFELWIFVVKKLGNPLVRP